MENRPGARPSGGCSSSGKTSPRRNGGTGAAPTPVSGEAMSRLGWLLERRGDVAEAERWYRRGADLGDGDTI